MTSQDEDPVDLERFACLADGGPDAEREIVALFLSSVDEQLKQMWSALNAGDLDALMRAAHTAGGAAGTCGARPLGARLLTVESAARDQQTGSLADDLRRAEEEFARLSEYLRSRPAR